MLDLSVNSLYYPLLVSVLMVILDIPYLMSIGPKWMSMVYKIQGGQRRTKPFIVVISSIIVYLLMGYAMTKFVVRSKGTILDAAILGGCFYGVFDFTNMVLFADYRWEMAVIDMIWGAGMFAMVAKLLGL